MKPKPSETPGISKRPIDVPPVPAVSNVFKSPRNDPMIDTNYQPHKGPIINNLVRSNDRPAEGGAASNQHSQAEFDPAQSNLTNGSQDQLPRIPGRSGKIQMKKTFKPSNVKPGDFEGM